jgi:hypothetical protein
MILMYYPPSAEEHVGHSGLGLVVAVAEVEEGVVRVL